MNDAPDPAAIAASLGTTQRRALKWLPASGDWSGEPPGDFKDTLLAMPDELCDMGFGGSNFVYRITPLGRAVAAEIREANGA